MSTLKEILDTVCDDALEEREASYVSNNKTEYQRLVRYANKAVRDILTVHNWSRLKKRGVINVVDGTTVYDLPSTFSHLIDETSHAQGALRSSNVPSNDQIIALSDVRNVTKYMGRLIGDKIELINFPSGDFTYQYMSKAVIVNYGVTSIAGEDGTSDKFLDDRDEWLLDDELLVRAILWRWQRAEGDADWQASMNDFTNYFRNMKGKDTGARNISRRGRVNYLTPPDVDEYSY